MRPKLVPELISSDLTRSRAFYVGLLGFRVLYDRPEERFLFLEREGAELMIEQPLTRERLWPAAPLETPFGRGVNLQIECDDVLALHDACRRAGASIVLPLEERWYRRKAEEVGNRQFAVADPDGYLLRLFSSLGTRSVA